MVGFAQPVSREVAHRGRSGRLRPLVLAIALTGLIAASAGAAIETGIVSFEVKFNDTTLGGSALGADDGFGSAVASLGDLDGNGFQDVAIVARSDDDQGSGSGAIYILYLDEGGVLDRPAVKITVPGAQQFAEEGLAFLGDYDGDGNVELAVGADFYPSGSNNSGKVTIVDLDPDTGAYQSHWEIRSGEPIDFTTLASVDRFGFALANLGDWNGDGAPEIGVSAVADGDGGTNTGALYVIYLSPPPTPATDATGIETWVRFGDSAGMGGVLAGGNFFGTDVAGIPDLDGDGQDDLVVGASDRGLGGSVFVLFMHPACSAPLGAPPAIPNAACQIESFVEIGGASGTLTSGSQLATDDRFGFSVAWIADESGFRPDLLAVGARDTNSGFDDRGAVWLLTLDANGAVSDAEIVQQSGAQLAGLGNDDFFGHRVTGVGDFDGDGSTDLLVGAIGDDDGAGNAGAAWLVGISPCTSLVTNPIAYYAPGDDGIRLCPAPELETFPATLHLYIDSGPLASTNANDVCEPDLGDGDELCAFEVAVTLTGGLTIESYTPAGSNPPPAPLEFITGERHNAPGPGSQELRVAWLATGAGPVGPIKIGDLVVDWDGSEGTARVGASSAGIDAGLRIQQIPPLDLIRLPEPAAAWGLAAGAVFLAWLARRRRGGSLFLLACVVGLVPSLPATAATAVKDFIILRETGVLNWPAGVEDYLGQGVTQIGDFGGVGGGDGVLDFAFGAPRDDTCTGTESVYLVFTDSLGTPLGFEGPISESGDAENFGWALAPLDLDGDGQNELAIGAPGCGGGSPSSVVLVTLDDEGREASRTSIDDAALGNVLDLDDALGISLAALGDIDGDPTNVELAIGAYGDDDGATDAGAIYIVSLDASGSVVWSQKVGNGSGGFGGTLGAGDLFGTSIAMLDDLDGPGPADFALAVGASRDDDGGTNRGAVWILFLDSTGPGNVSVISESKISATAGGFVEAGGALSNDERWGQELGFRAVPDGEGRGVLYASLCASCFALPAAAMHVLYLDQDGSVMSTYRLSETSGHGFFDDAGDGVNLAVFGSGIAPIDDFDGDQAADLIVGAKGSATRQGAVILMFLQDSDFDGLDDELDNCPFVHNPRQLDGDDDGTGDLCDNCPLLFNDTQADFDLDGEGDVCEPVEVQLQLVVPTPPMTPQQAPEWNLFLQCGAFDVTALHGAIVLPAGSTNPKTLTLSGASIGAGSGSSGPGLAVPAGVRGDAIYFSAFGNGAPDNRLCTALDPPVLLGTLTTGAIGGTQLAAAALTEEGVGTPGFGLNLAFENGVPIVETAIRLVNSAPLPILDLELGPAVETASGTKWEVRVVRSNDEFHRLAFGLIAPAGTTTADMRWLGCDTTPDPGGARDCCESPPCGDFDGLGVGTNVNPNRTFTIGPQSSPPGTQLPDTMYVVLEGSALSNGALDTVNPAAEGAYHVLGEIELLGSPDLEPALTVDGANDLDDLFSAGKVNPLVDVSTTARDLDEVKLIGAFNPADDLDGDGIQDLGDNCPFEPNPAQTNRGSFLDTTDDSDALGDACQCAEATGDGAITDPTMVPTPPAPYDFDQIFDLLAGKISNPLVAEEIRARCSVAGTTDCDIRDLVFLQRAIAAGDPNVETRCDAALSPVPAL